MLKTESQHVGPGLLLSLLALPIVTVVYGATLAKLWQWFVADTFHILAISTAEAIGISMVITFITYQPDARKDSDYDLAKTVTNILSRLLQAALTLGFGAIVKSFI